MSDSGKRGVTTRLTDAEEADFEAIAGKLLRDPQVRQMCDYVQHGPITTYDHCVDVARCAFKLARRLHVRVDEEALVTAGLLHDYYLYDWHVHGDKLHGSHHPHIAAENAQRDFAISDKAAGAIRSHMWPLTLTYVPHSREAWLVTLADKICSSRETLFERHARRQ